MLVLAAPDAKPHCGLSASRSNGIYCVASRRRASTAAASSRAGFFVVTNPSTTACCGRTWRSGPKSPARGVSYSNSSLSKLLSRENTLPAIRS